MNKDFQTDQQLIEAIIDNNPQVWPHLIDQYQGRLLNYARMRVRQVSDAEDAVQETFISLLNTLQKSPNKVIENLETYLFTILRNYIYSQYRTRWAKSVCLIQDVVSSSEDEANDMAGQIASSDPSATRIIRQKEQTELERILLTKKLKEIVSKCKKTLDFQSLKLMDLLFYSRLNNSNTARLLDLNESSVRVFKHRFIKHLSEDLKELLPEDTQNDGTLQDSLLSEIWEQNRLTCPKHSTLGNFILENIEPGWFDYIDFHLTTFGCHFCRASFKDLQKQQHSEAQTLFRDKLIASTIGFFTKTY